MTWDAMIAAEQRAKSQCAVVGPEGGVCIRQFPQLHSEHCAEDGEMWTT